MIYRNRTESGWGPNAVFRFPQHGGTGGIWKGVAKLLPQERMRFGQRGQVTHIDAAAKTLMMGDGTKIKYGKLLSTIPLDITLIWLGRKDLADRLTYSSRYIIINMSPHSMSMF